MKTFFVIRHGQTEWNVARRMQGRLDSPLTREGVEQAHKHGLLLKTLPSIERMYVSPSGRTRETAYIVNSYVRAELSYEDALLERDCGDWSGLSVDEIEDASPGAWQRRLEDPFHHRPPGGENLADMARRCAGFLEQLLEAPHDRVALVTHQVMSRVILGALLDLDPDEVVRLIHPNEALYQVGVDVDEVSVQHFIAGRGPLTGLLRHGDDETIPPLDPSSGALTK
jgi:broad specificity phosphatase PhoE